MKKGIVDVEAAERIASKAVDFILKDFTDRRGLRQAWESIDEDTRQSILEAWRRRVESAVLAETEAP